MKTQFQKYLAVISACVILLSMAAPAFATEPTAAEEAIDYDKRICATWYIDLDGKSIDDFVYPDSNITWSGTMEALSTGTPSSLKVYKTPETSADGSCGILLDFCNNWGLSLGSATIGLAPGSEGSIPFGNISCTVSKIRIVAPDPVSANNEKLYKWFKANGFFSAAIPDQGGSSGDPATEQVSGLSYSFWQLNETISLPAEVPATYSAPFSLPYVDADMFYTSFAFTSKSMKYDSMYAYSFDNSAWVDDKYRYIYFDLTVDPAVGLLRWLKDNARIVAQSPTTIVRPTVIDDLYGSTWTFHSFSRTSESIDVTCAHVTDACPNGGSNNRIRFTNYDDYAYPYFRITGNGKNGYIRDWYPRYFTDFSIKWIRFEDHCTDKKLIQYLLDNATLSEWPSEPLEIPPYVPLEQGGVLGSGGVSVGGGGSVDTSQGGWITGGGLIGTQPLPGLNAGFLSWLAGTMDGIMNVNLFGFFSLADILSFCLTISIILILLKFFGG